MEMTWSEHGVHVEMTWTDVESNPLFMDSMPYFMDSIFISSTPCGVHMD